MSRLQVLTRDTRHDTDVMTWTDADTLVNNCARELDRDELRQVDGWDWVRLAAAASDYNPVLRYVSVTGGVAVATDRKRLHLEARMNYEAQDTGSVWAGVNFSGGDTLAWELTPMVGGVFGDTSGVAPGYRGSLAWRALEFYSEGEAVIDADESTDSFLYNWSELTLAPVEWLRFGLVTQRTRAYQADRVVQRGLLVGVTIRRLDVTTYIFNPDDSKPIVVLAVGVSF